MKNEARSRHLFAVETLPSQDAETRSRNNNHLQQVGVARALLALSVHRDHTIAGLDHAISFGACQRFGDHGVRAHEGRREHWYYASHATELPDCGLAGGDRQDRGARAVLGDDLCCVARLGESDDQRAVRVDRGLDRRGADGLHARHLLHLGHGVAAEAQVQGLVLHDLLRLLANAAHDGHGVERELPGRRLAREHDAVRAVEHRVRDIARLRARGPRQPGHGLEHLRGGDHRLTHQVAPANHHLLRQEHLLRWDFHAQVSTRHHDAVARLNDRVEVLEALLILNLGDDLNGAPADAQGLPDKLDVFCTLHE
mmetsp:Transcript_1935/g.4805  ORF Transcript_1935/g.4805 Transcript_1935/m.4805 type:complete len:312 (+) Transcript_1935:74-1009(+)